MIGPLPKDRDYSSLSVRDLVEAREHYHVHLAHMENVVATAIGRYRIRDGDWFATHPPGTKPPAGYKKPTAPRTLFNSSTKPWSWPCVLVFVDRWVERGSEDAISNPDQIVPRALYLPDGRVVPTCVVQTTVQPAPAGSAERYRFAKTFIGGGYPVLSQQQGSEHLGSIGCLVSDGNATHGLTSRHVTGDAGREIFSIVGAERVRVGVSDERQIGKRPFESVYAGWPGRQVHCNLDVGLVRVDDVSIWTTQVLGIGALDALVDLNTETLTLDLVDCPVRAFGAASGPLFGRIAGFFYRYRSVGGFDYVSDLIIAPRPDPARAQRVANTLPGDSGTLWCLEQPNERGGVRMRPIALEWGGQVIVDSGTRGTTARSFTLATALSTICRELDLELLRDGNTGLPEYWGAVGHYTIAAIACTAVRAAKLKKLMAANAERVSYSRATIERGATAFSGLSGSAFIPLADVPDYAWKGGVRSGEQPNHFADMDAVVPDGEWKGKTLLDLCADDANVDVAVWQKYYELVKDASKGTLPFRVWQIFSAMKGYAQKKDVARFVAAAGVLAHYVGDACQPLHISFMYDGVPQAGGGKRGKGVHHAYEAGMFNSFVAELWDGIEDRLGAAAAPPAIATGRDAAIATVGLMRRTFTLMKPQDIVDAYVAKDDLWQRFGDATKQTMANGVVLLAALWDAAWKAGGGDAAPVSKLAAIDEKRLAALYANQTFLPSKRIKDIASVLGD